MKSKTLLILTGLGLAVSCLGTAQAAEAKGPVKVFILAGDANCLEQGALTAATEGRTPCFFQTKNRRRMKSGRHVNCAVYKGAYKAGTDYEKLTPAWTGIVGIGENQAMKKKPSPSRRCLKSLSRTVTPRCCADT